MKYGIIVDSGCDLEHIECTKECAISFCRAPLKLQVGEKIFVDDFALDVQQYMQELTDYPGKSGSAAPSPGEWYDAYKTADEVFAITITGTLSGSYASAMTARNILLEEVPDKKIHVIDSKSAGPELTLLVMKLQEFMKQGDSFDNIVTKITDYQNKTHLLFVLESLDSLMKNGRISKLEGGMAGILGIKILGCASKEGTLAVLEKCRGKLNAYQHMIKEMAKKGYHGSKVIISHCFNQEKAEYIKEQIQKLYPKSHITIMATSGLCSYYAQRGGILLAFEE